mmetsp:Transcript_93408/g.301918  ORF Transcript_93408/g.301918 Transcript_93408/m.301918 type:complete len:155 (+) Transcript_93408:197-661(+)
MRPCFNSTDLRRLKDASSPSAVKPNGSQKPTGACTPSSLSNARMGRIWRSTDLPLRVLGERNSSAAEAQSAAEPRTAMCAPAVDADGIVGRVAASTVVGESCKPGRPGTPEMKAEPMLTASAIEAAAMHIILIESDLKAIGIKLATKRVGLNVR